MENRPKAVMNLELLVIVGDPISGRVIMDAIKESIVRPSKGNVYREEKFYVDDTVLFRVTQESHNPLLGLTILVADISKKFEDVIDPGKGYYYLRVITNVPVSENEDESMTDEKYVMAAKDLRNALKKELQRVFSSK